VIPLYTVTGRALASLSALEMALGEEMDDATMAELRDAPFNPQLDGDDDPDAVADESKGSPTSNTLKLKHSTSNNSIKKVSSSNSLSAVSPSHRRRGSSISRTRPKGRESQDGTRESLNGSLPEGDIDRAKNNSMAPRSPSQRRRGSSINRQSLLKVNRRESNDTMSSTDHRESLDEEGIKGNTSMPPKSPSHKRRGSAIPNHPVIDEEDQRLTTSSTPKGYRRRKSSAMRSPSSNPNLNESEDGPPDPNEIIGMMIDEVEDGDSPHSRTSGSPRASRRRNSSIIRSPASKMSLRESQDASPDPKDSIGLMIGGEEEGDSGPPLRSSSSPRASNRRRNSSVLQSSPSKVNLGESHDADLNESVGLMIDGEEEGDGSSPRSSSSSPRAPRSPGHRSRRSSSTNRSSLTSGLRKNISFNSNKVAPQPVEAMGPTENSGMATSSGEEVTTAPKEQSASSSSLPLPSSAISSTTSADPQVPLTT